MRARLAAHSTHRLLSALACAALATRAAAATPVSGDVGGQTWTAAGSPYVADADLAVADGTTLTLEAGTVVQFGNGRRLHVSGALAVNGTEASPVSFEAEHGTTVGLWKGIVVSNAATSVTLTHARVTAAEQGVFSTAPGTRLAIHDSIFRNCSQGLRLSGGAPVIDGVTISGGNTGIWVDGYYTSPTISRAVIRGVTNSGMEIDPHGPATVDISASTVDLTGAPGFPYGLYATSDASHPVVNIVNSIFTGGEHGISRLVSSDPAINATQIQVNVTYTDVWGSRYPFELVTPGVGVISANPLYASATDLHLTEHSPARFGGDAGQDLGALPYAGAPSPGLVGTIWEDLVVPVGTTTVPGTVTVPPGVTLTLLPGTVLAVTDGDVMKTGISAIQPHLVVQGTLVAEGNAAAPVAFRSETGTVRGWYGIDLVSASEASTISHATIEGAHFAVNFATTTATRLVDVTVDRPSYGVQITAGTFEVDAVTVTSPASAGVWMRGHASGTIANAVVVGSGADGIHLEGSGTVSIVNSTIHGNGLHGMYVAGGTGGLTATVKSCLVTRNGQSGVYKGGTTTLDITSSDVWGNGSGGTTNFLYVTPTPATAISEDPLYVSAPGDLRLQAGSPAVDTGDATGAPGHDRAFAPRPLDGDGVNGPRVDMGAFERVLVAGCGDAHVDAGETCDDGVRNGAAGFCNATCSAISLPPVTPAPPAPSGGGGGGGGCGVAAVGGDAALLLWLAPLALRRRRRGTPAGIFNEH